jgi:hypothetical protein
MFIYWFVLLLFISEKISHSPPHREKTGKLFMGIFIITCDDDDDDDVVDSGVDGFVIMNTLRIIFSCKFITLIDTMWKWKSMFRSFNQRRWDFSRMTIKRVIYSLDSRWWPQFTDNKINKNISSFSLFWFSHLVGVWCSKYHKIGFIFKLKWNKIPCILLMNYQCMNWEWLNWVVKRSKHTFFVKLIKSSSRTSSMLLKISDIFCELQNF